MKSIKNLVAVTFLVAFCLFSTSLVLAQNRTDSKITQAQLSQIKGKQIIFVDIANETTKRRVEDFLTKDGKFQVTQNIKNAEIVYASMLQTESVPSFGTVENRTDLAILPPKESSNIFEQNNSNQVRRNDYDYRGKTSATVYYDEPDGKRVTLWSKETLRITKSTESGAVLEIFRKSGDELSLAKQFVKAVKSLK